MNPSAQGWIKKLLKEVAKNNVFLSLVKEDFYFELRQSGFIYGSNQHVIFYIIVNPDLTEEELCKTNLCLALYYTYHNSQPKTSFIDSVIDFYTHINVLKTSFFQGLIGGKKSNDLLEKIIHKRIQIDDNFLTKNFNYFIINALLYVDILAYEVYLEKESVPSNYIKNLEATIETISISTFNSKKIKNQYDEGLIKLFESSLRYHSTKPVSYIKAISNIKTDFEKFYILDLACMASWSDKVIDRQEMSFLQQLGSDLEINPFYVDKSIETVNNFYTTNKDHIALLSSKNVVQSFYNNSSKMVKKLISRNSKRLYRELKDSKELMVLLSQSTKRDLSPDEQKKVQEQLLDIFKSIPSLAIFLLPGGAILLPLVIKFIPKLLPSAFDENRIEE